MPTRNRIVAPHTPNVVVEGVDGSGKTTLGKRLAAAFESRYLDAPYESYLQGKGIADRLGGTARYEFYRASNQVTSWLLRHVLEGPVVLDKYQMSTVAFARAMGQSAIWQEGLWEPDVTIYLAAQPGVRDERLDTRPDKPRHRYETSAILDQAAIEYEQLIAERESHGNRIISIDTAGLTSEGVFLAVCERLGRPYADRN